MLLVCVIDFMCNWDEHLPLVEFSKIIIIILLSPWHLMRLRMGGGVDHQLGCLSLVSLP